MNKGNSNNDAKILTETEFKETIFELGQRAINQMSDSKYQLLKRGAMGDKGAIKALDEMRTEQIKQIGKH